MPLEKSSSSVPGNTSGWFEKLAQGAPVRLGNAVVQSPFVRCKEARVMLGGRCVLDRCERAGWLAPVKRGKRLTLFKRADIEAAVLRISWGELP